MKPAASCALSYQSFVHTLMRLALPLYLWPPFPFDHVCYHSRRKIFRKQKLLSRLITLIDAIRYSESQLNNLSVFLSFSLFDKEMDWDTNERRKWNGSGFSVLRSYRLATLRLKIRSQKPFPFEILIGTSCSGTKLQHEHFLLSI